MTIQDWQPIETAPPTNGHGLHLLLYVPRYALGSLVVEGWVNHAERGAWVAHNGGQIEPTHWMPLPPPPQVASEAPRERREP